MLLFGLESSRSPHQCLIGLYFRCSSVQRILPRDPTEREFLLKSSRVLPVRCFSETRACAAEQEFLLKSSRASPVGCFSET